MQPSDDRPRRLRDAELALARQLADIHAYSLTPQGGPIAVAAFQHRADTAGVTLAAIRPGDGRGLRIDIVDAGGLGPVGGILAAQCGLELLHRNETVDLVGLNRHFLAHPTGESALLAAAALDFESDGLEWTGSFAGLPAPILVDDSGLVEILMGSGPFLGLAATTFPVIRGLLHPGKRFFLVAGADAGNLVPVLCERLPKTLHLPLDELVDRLGRELVAELEPGFGLLLLGVERKEFGELLARRASEVVETLARASG